MGRKNTGFTLVELVIVITIIGILATIAIAYFRGQTFKANDAKRKGDINRIKVAAEEYEKDHNCYPVAITCGVLPNQQVYPYLNEVPCDPITHASYVYEPDSSSICPKWYRIYTNLENAADTSILSGIGPHAAFNYFDSSPNASSVTQSVSSTPPPSEGGGGALSGYWGCKNGACVPLNWSNARPGPECDPSFRNDTCYGVCMVPSNTCVPWK